MKRTSKNIITSEPAKELNCLYGISGKMVQPNYSTEEIMQATMDAPLSSWQYPEITSACLTYKAGPLNRIIGKTPNEYTALTLLT